MWRKLHRWFGLITGIFFAFVALTGISMQVISLVKPDGPPSRAPSAPHDDGKDVRGGPGADNAAPPQSRAAGVSEGPAFARKPDLYQLLDHIHDGEFAGPFGRVISLILGLALLFFSISGLWMYWTMYRGRSEAGRKGAFW